MTFLCRERPVTNLRTEWAGQYVAERIDKAVCGVVHAMFLHIKDAPDEAVLQKRFKKEMSSCKAKQTKLKLEQKKNTHQLEKLVGEIAKTLTGDSSFIPEQLLKAMKTVESKISEINVQLEQLENEISGKKISMEKIRPMYERFTSWADEFDTCSIERKKMIISQLISRIEVGKGYKVTALLNMDYEQFCEDWDIINAISCIEA